METCKTKNGDRYKEKVRLPSGRMVTKTFPTKTLAKIWKKKMDTEKFQGLLGMKSIIPIPFQVFAEKWFEERVTHTLAQRTVETYGGTLFGRIIPEFGKLKVHQITQGQVEAFTLSMVKERLKAKTVNRAVTILRQILIHAQRDKHIAEIPSMASLFMKPGKASVSAFTDSEAKALLRANRNKSIHPVLFLALHSGMRRGEILGLCWDRVNFHSEKIEITRTLHRGRVLQERTKGGSVRYFPMNEELKKFLLELRRTQTSPQFVFADAEGNPYNPNHFSEREFSDACKCANVRRLRFHDLRHTFASHFMMSGGSLLDLKELLGHTEIKTTMIYAHLSPGHLKKASGIVSFGESFGQNGAAGPVLALKSGR